MKFSFKNKIFFNLKYFFIKKTYYLKSPQLTAYFWIKFSDILFPEDIKLNRSVLVFNNGGGDLDLLSRPKNRTNKEKYLLISKSSTDDMLISFFGNKRFDYTYDNLIRDQKHNYKQYIKFINSLVFYLNKKHNVIGFINFNHVYSSHREIISVASNKKIPFVVVFKECFKNEHLWKKMTSVYKKTIKKSNVSRIIVHNHDTKNAILESGIINQKKISIVGQARSDKLFFKNKIKISSRKKIIFFAVSPHAGLPNFNLNLLGNRSKDESERKLLIKLREEHNQKILKSLINYVEYHDEFDLIVKGKQKFWFNFSDINKNNIFFEAGQPNFDLLLSSSVVVGYNTTGLIEAVAADVPAISVELKEERKYRHDYLNVIHQVDETKFLWKKLDQILYDKIAQDNKNKNYIIDKYLGNSDGKAGIRLWNELDRAWD